MAIFSDQGRRLTASLLVLSMAQALSSSAWAAGLPPIRESQSLGEVVAPPPMSNELPSLSVADRVDRLEGLLEGQALVEMLMRIETLQNDVQELRGQNEVYAHEIEGMKKRQRDLYMDIDRRLRQVVVSGVQNMSPSNGDLQNPAMQDSGGQNSGQGISSMSSQTAVTPSSGIAGVGAGNGAMPQAQANQDSPVTNSAGGALQVPAIDPLAEQSAYRTAFNILKEGRYEDSISGFNQFLSSYPSGQYADNAIYWIGEANYVLRRFSGAIESFNRVLKNYPDSPKLPDAMLKIGFSQYELQQWPQSRQMLEALVQRYPTSTASQLAKSRLQQMKVEDR